MCSWVRGRSGAGSCGRLPTTDPIERHNGRLVGFRQRVQVLLGGLDAAVSESFLDDLEVGAASKKP